MVYGFLIHTILIIGAVIMLLPFVWTVLTSLKPLHEVTRIPLTIFPEEIKLENYSLAMATLPFINLYINTFVMIIARIICAVVFSSMAGYAFARINFPGSKILFYLVLIQMMVPAQIFLIPQYLIVAKLGLLNSIPALIVPGLVSAFGTFLLRQFFKALPSDLEEAAILDGCNQWQIYRRVMLPLAGASLSALGIFTAVFAWKELMWPLIVNMSMNKMTLSSGLATLIGHYETSYPVLMASAFIAIWPMLLLFVIFQKRFVEGIALTGTKG
ncbi:MAG: carbohydrate ABC transporter permease [Spirochaetales bacterium]|nr:carbohydrate ABC transporter permease [Spirochaetales bacterium]